MCHKDEEDALYLQDVELPRLRDLMKDTEKIIRMKEAKLANLLEKEGEKKEEG